MPKSAIRMAIITLFIATSSAYAQNSAMTAFETVTAVKLAPGRYQVIGKKADQIVTSSWFSRLANKPITNDDCYRLAIIAYSNAHPFSIGGDPGDSMAAVTCSLGKE